MTQQDLQDRVTHLEKNMSTWNRRAWTYFVGGLVGLGTAGLLNNYVGLSPAAVTGGMGLYGLAYAALSRHQADLLEDRVAEIKQSPEYIAQHQPNQAQA